MRAGSGLVKLARGEIETSPHGWEAIFDEM